MYPCCVVGFVTINVWDEFINKICGDMIVFCRAKFGCVVTRNL